MPKPMSYEESPDPMAYGDVRDKAYYTPRPKVGTQMMWNGRVVEIPPQNWSGQPTEMVDGREMFPNRERTQLVPNPLYRPGGMLPEMIPADMAAELGDQMARMIRK